jgi:hypothetical protein
MKQYAPPKLYLPTSLFTQLSTAKDLALQHPECFNEKSHCLVDMVNTFWAYE